MTDPTLLAWAYLSRVVEPPCAELAVLVDQVGPVDAAERVRRGQVDATLARHTQARREIDRAAEDLELLARRGGRLITPDNDEWPTLAFAAFGGAAAAAKPQCRPPMVLWVLGPARLDETAQRAAAIVGTRAATGYGERVAADLAVGLVEHDVAVVSGGAYGIDGAAHRAALGAEGITVGVLAGGIDIPYPAGHSAMLHRIGGNGLLVTEYPPGVRPARHRFLTRNRLVAAFAGAAVVVEAGLRSGAANTAAWARLLGRVVGAVPGPVTRRRRRVATPCCVPARRSSPVPRTSSSWWVASGSWRPTNPGRRRRSTGSVTSSGRCTRRCRGGESPRSTRLPSPPRWSRREY